MAKVFNWGIIGPGRIAEKFSIAVQGISGSQIYAVASRSSSDLEKLGKKFSTANSYSSYKQLAENPDVDAVYIATPHNFHYENAKLCLTHHKPVLLEKPFTVNARQAKDLISTAKKENVFIMEAMWTRFLPIYKVVRKWLDRNTIGEIRLVRSTLGFVARRDPNDRLLNPDLAGGTVLDLGVYNTAASQFVFQRQPDNISAVGFIGHTGVDEAISVSMHYGIGMLSEFSCSFLTHPQSRMGIYGTKGRIIIHPMFNSAEEVSLFIDGKKKTVRKPLRINGFEYQIEEAQKAIRRGLIENPLMPHQNILDNMIVLDRIRKIIGLQYPFE